MKIAPLKTDRKVRTLVFSFDEKYAKYFSVALLSLIPHLDRDCLYDLIVLYDNLSEQTMEDLKALVPEGTVLRFFDAGSCARGYLGDLAGSTSNGRWAVSTFYDLLVPLIMPEYERVLYCDSDIVFRADPGELFELSFPGCPLIAVRDAFPFSFAMNPGNEYLLKQKRILHQALGLTQLDQYFNTGVVLYSIPLIDKGAYLEKIRTALAFPLLPTADQDVLNYVFKGEAAIAPFRFNLQTSLLRELKNACHGGRKLPGAEAVLEAADSPVIVHYTTEDKPWVCPDCEMSGFFWKAAEQSPFYESILRENIEKLQRENRLRSLKCLLASILPGFIRRKYQDRIQRAKRKKTDLLRLQQKLRTFCLILLALALSGCGASKDAAVFHTALPDPVSVGNADPPSSPGLTEQRVLFSQDSGVYREKSLRITLLAPDGYTVAFTRNGELPTAADDSGRQQVEISLKRNESGYLIKNRDLMVYPDFPSSFLLDDPALPGGCVLRAAPVSPAGDIGAVDTEVYFWNMDFSARFPGCLVLSVVTEPDSLLDYETGILAAGSIYDSWKRTGSAPRSIAQEEIWEVQSNITQHGKAWERPCILHIFDGSAAPSVCSNAGIRVTGHASRACNQKSFNLYFRDSYGSAFLDYELFPGISEYKSFRLLSGGNNTDWLKFKDAFLRELVSDRHFTEAGSRPAVLFLNGEYWGPYLLTEKISAQMLHDHYGVEKKQVVLFKEGELEDGTEEDLPSYLDLMSYAEKDLADPLVWQDFCRIMDIQSMADYCAARIYFGDADWSPDRNDVLWRTRDSSYNGGRWQYVLYDVEYSAGMYGNEQTAAGSDHFRMAREKYPLFDAALENQEFSELFLASIREIGNINCDDKNVTEKLDAYLDVWKPLMPDYYKRFGDWKDLWNSALKDTRNFFKVRSSLLLPLIENRG